MANGETREKTIVWVAAAIVVPTILFAPLVFGGYCVDAPEGGRSYCESYQRSIVGIDTNWWLCAVVVAASLAFVWFTSRRPRV